MFLSKLCLVEGDTNSWLPLLRVPLMDHAEECLVLEGFNHSQVPYDPTTLVHGMFAVNARRHPEAPCLIFEGCVYSYAEVGQHSALNALSRMPMCSTSGMPPRKTGQAVGWGTVHPSHHAIAAGVSCRLMLLQTASHTTYATKLVQWLAT